MGAERDMSSCALVGVGHNNIVKIAVKTPLSPPTICMASVISGR